MILSRWSPFDRLSATAQDHPLPLLPGLASRAGRTSLGSTSLSTDAAGNLLGVVFLSITCMAAYVLIDLPRQKASTTAQQATIQAQNAQVAQAMTQTPTTSASNPLGIPTETVTLTQIFSPTPNPIYVVTNWVIIRQGPGTIYCPFIEVPHEEIEVTIIGVSETEDENGYEWLMVRIINTEETGWVRCDKVLTSFSNEELSNLPKSPVSMEASICP